MRTLILVVSVLLTIHESYGQIDGNWGDWTAWSTCSVTCLTGETLRTRACDNPPPSNGGRNCTGSGEESLTCVIMNYCLPSLNGNQDLNCAINEFGCATGIHRCLNISLRCDDNIDCEDGSDENPYFTGCDEKYCSAAHDFTPSVMTLVLMLLASLQLAKASWK